MLLFFVESSPHASITGKDSNTGHITTCKVRETLPTAGKTFPFIGCVVIRKRFQQIRQFEHILG